MMKCREAVGSVGAVRFWTFLIDPAMHREFATRDRATAACAAGGNMQIRNHEALAGLVIGRIRTVDYCTR